MAGREAEFMTVTSSLGQVKFADSSFTSGSMGVFLDVAGVLPIVTASFFCRNKA